MSLYTPPTIPCHLIPNPEFGRILLSRQSSPLLCQTRKDCQLSSLSHHCFLLIGYLPPLGLSLSAAAELKVFASGNPGKLLSTRSPLSTSSLVPQLCEIGLPFTKGPPFGHPKVLTEAQTKLRVRRAASDEIRQGHESMRRRDARGNQSDIDPDPLSMRCHTCWPRSTTRRGKICAFG